MIYKEPYLGKHKGAPIWVFWYEQTQTGKMWVFDIDQDKWIWIPRCKPDDIGVLCKSNKLEFLLHTGVSAREPTGNVS
jgi:hypothetical protein